MEWQTIFVILGVILFGALLMFNYVKRKKITFLQGLARVMARLIIAAIGLYILNQIGSLIDLHLAINPFTVTITGLLGIPGVLSLVIIKYLVIQ